MKVGLFIPCYVDQFYPKVGIASLKLLQSLGVEVHYPLDQTCCGQPMANSGFENLSQPCNENFIHNFSGYDAIVGPSGSCVLHIKDHLHSKKNNKEATHIKNNIFELVEFLVDILKLDKLPGAFFPYKVGLHTACHGQRGLGLSSSSEIMGEKFSKPEYLLSLVKGLELVPLKRSDECCGFGGTFSIFEEAISVKMGKDRVKDFSENRAEYITGGDMSCLMHLEGILKKNGSNMEVMHIAEILATGL